MSLLKEMAAAAAMELVEDGMTLGLGSGSTAEIFVRLLGEDVGRGLNVRGVPTSENTAQVARQSGVPLVPIDQVETIHLTIDGADEVDPDFRLIKGGGACLLREKIIAHASEQMAVIVDPSKMVEQLGAFPLPVEIDPFGMGLTAEAVFRALKETGCKTAETHLRMSQTREDPLVTDGGHYILDCPCEEIPDPEATAFALSQIPGVMEHGLFIGLAKTVIVGEDDHAKMLFRKTS